MTRIRLGAFPPLQGPAPLPEMQAAFVNQAAEAGLDHVCAGDHVSFFVGAGSDGLTTATALLAAQPDLPV